MKEAKHKRKHVLLRCIADYFKAHPVALIISAICTLISALGPIVAPLMIQKVTNLIATAIEKEVLLLFLKNFMNV